MPPTTRRWTPGRGLLAVVALLATGAVACGPVSPPPPPNPPASPTYGAKPLGTTNYPVVGTARWVSRGGNDGAAGTQTSPWRTLGKAVSSAPNGATIVLRAGVYGEAVEIPADKRLTIQPAPGETVWLSGSDIITGWAPSGGDWRRTGFTPSFSAGSLDPALVQPSHPVAGDPDLAFLNGRPLRQVGSRNAVVPGTFFVDDPGNTIWIGDDPSGKIVEAATRAEALTIKSSGTVVRGIGFRGYATHISRLGTVKARASRITFEHVHFRDNAAAGLSVTSADVRVLSCTAEGNGQLGIHADGAHRLLVERSLLRGNNREHFSAIAASGGIKATGSDVIVVRRNLVEGNFAHGIWLDLGADFGTVVRNISRRNTAGGITIEMSNAEIIASNVTVDNDTGIVVSETSAVDIYNNVVLGNERSLYIVDGHRSPTPADIAVRNSVLAPPSAGSDRPLFIADDVTQQRSATNMRVTTDRNRYYRRSTSTAPYVATWANYPSGKLLFRTLTDMQARTGQERSSAISDNATRNPYVEDAAAGRYNPPPGSTLATAGIRVPSRVATALQIPEGTTMPIGILPG
jgi:Right handed beta helix region/Protein of unknown function (DUF1565)